MVALNVLRGLASLVPTLGGATYMGSEKPEGIEEVFKAVTGTSGISRASEDLTKEINVKKVAEYDYSMAIMVRSSHRFDRNR